MAHDRTTATQAQLSDLAEIFHALMAVGLRQRPRDISLTSASTLATLGRSGPTRITDLAALEGVAQPSMTALVNALENIGLVERHRDECDGRVALVSLTSKGEEYLVARRAAGAEAYVRLMEKLPPEHIRSLLAAVPAFSQMLDLHGDRRQPADDR